MTVREDCLSKYFEVVHEKQEMEKELSDKEQKLSDKDKELSDKDKALAEEKKAHAEEKKELEDMVRMLQAKAAVMEKASGSSLQARLSRQGKRAAGCFSSFCKVPIRLIQNLNQEFNV